MKKIKLLRIINTLDPRTGGPVSGIMHVTEALNQLHIETTILCLDEQNDEYLKGLEANIICLGKGKTRWNYHPGLKKWLKNHLDKFDVSIIHGIWLYHAYAGIRLFIHEQKSKSNFKHKMYIFPHGMLDPYFQIEKKRRLKAIRNVVYWNLIERKNVNQASGLLFTSQAEMELAQNTFKGYNPKEKFNIGYGVKVMNDNIPNHTEVRDYLLFLGRIDPKKGIEFILQAYLIIAQNNPLILPKLIIAGPTNNPKYYQKIEQLIEQNNILKELVTIYPAQHGINKWFLIQHARAQILWSHQENFGLAVAESLGMGVPVLLSKGVNISNLVQNKKAGMVADLNINCLTQSLENFLTLDTDSYIQMKKNALALFNLYFLPSSYAKRLRSIFEND